VTVPNQPGHTFALSIGDGQRVACRPGSSARQRHIGIEHRAQHLEPHERGGVASRASERFAFLEQTADGVSGW